MQKHQFTLNISAIPDKIAQHHLVGKSLYFGKFITFLFLGVKRVSLIRQALWNLNRWQTLPMRFNVDACPS
jgi:hypothetical protein